MKAHRWTEGAAFFGKDGRPHDGRYHCRSVRAVGQNTAVMESVVFFLSAHIGDGVAATRVRIIMTLLVESTGHEDAIRILSLAPEQSPTTG